MTVTDMEKHLWAFQEIAKDPETGKIVIPAKTPIECLVCGHAIFTSAPRLTSMKSGVRCAKCNSRKVCIGGTNQTELLMRLDADEMKLIKNQIKDRTVMPKTKTDKPPKLSVAVDDAVASMLTPKGVELKDALKAEEISESDLANTVDTDDTEPTIPPEAKAEAQKVASGFKLRIGNGKGVELTSDTQIDAPMMTPDEVMKRLGPMPPPGANNAVAPMPTRTANVTLDHVPGAGTTIDGKPVISWDENAVKMAAKTLSDMIKFIAEKYAMEGMPQDMAQANAESLATVLWMYKDYLSANSWIVLVFVLMRLGQTAFWAMDARKKNIKLAKTESLTPKVE